VVTRVVQPSSDRALTGEQGAPSTQFNTWLRLISERALIIGTGAPENVIEANQGALYLDETGGAGNLLYIKRNADIGGDRTQGWILV